MNPVQGGLLSATSAEEWIHDFDCDQAGQLTFTADANESDQSRSQTLTLTYTYGQGKSVEARITAVQDATTASEQYDFDLTLDIFTGTYYGDDFGSNGEHNWYIWISDKEFTPDGYAQNGGTYYLFDTYGPAPQAGTGIALPAGEYALGASGATAEMTFSSDYSKFMQVDDQGNTIHDAEFTKGRMVVSYEGETLLLEAFLTDLEGNTHHVVYNGPASYASDTIYEDIDLKATSCSATYMDSDGELMALLIEMSDMGSGSVTTPGTKLTLNAFMPVNDTREPVTGTYTVSDGGGSMTLQPGSSYYGIPEGSYAFYFKDSNNIQMGLIASGSMTITGGGDSYTVTCDLVTAEGCNVTASYTGSIALTDSSGETGDAVSTLTGDYTLDLDGATAEASFYGDYYGTGGGNWTISILPTTGPDGLLIDLVAGEGSFDGGITSGTYTAADNDYPAPGEYLRGMVCSDGGLGGTIYVGDFDSEGYVYAYAPAMSGNLDITNNGDGSYTLSFDFIDDRGYAWDGSWSGTISTADYSYYSASAMTRSLLRAPHSGYPGTRDSRIAQRNKERGRSPATGDLPLRFGPVRRHGSATGRNGTDRSAAVRQPKHGRSPYPVTAHPVTAPERALRAARGRGRAVRSGTSPARSRYPSGRSSGWRCRTSSGSRAGSGSGRPPRSTVWRWGCRSAAARPRIRLRWGYRSC